MVPPYSHRVSRVRRYSGYSQRRSHFAYRTITLFRLHSHTILLYLRLLFAVRTPKVLLPLVWPLPRSLATTCGISVDFSSSPYLDVSVQAVPLVYLFYSVYDDRTCLRSDCSIRKSADISPTYGSPQLIAVCHVLLRLLVPRHSPCALCSLTISCEIIIGSIFLENCSIVTC